MNELQEALDECVARCPGEEFALFLFPPDDWRAEMVNPAFSVSLGESSGTYQGEGNTALDAVRQLLRVLPSAG